MKNKIILLLLLVCALSMPIFAKAITIDELKVQVARLQAQIAQLVAQLAQMQGGATTAWCHNFNTNLGIGSSGGEVAALHTALQKDGVWNVTGFGDTKYDEETASYVVGFQEKYASEILKPYNLKHGTGYVGKSTRAKLNKLYGCGNIPKACTAEAKQCPDGSYVGRSGPNCEVAQCPVVQMPSSTASTVIIVIEETLFNDQEIRSKIIRYENDNNKYNFKEIIFNKTGDSIKGMADIGGSVKHNSLELRNTIKEIYRTNSKVVGVWLIGDIRPTIWREASLWRDLGTSGFYPSIYPLVAIDQDYYVNFDPKSDGFYEEAGATKGSEIGGGYNATIWGAALIPPTFDKNLQKDLIKQFLDRDHAYRVGTLKYDKKLLYSDVFGCSNKMINAINSSSEWETSFLCPNFSDQLNGFDSGYIIRLIPSNYSGPSTFIEAITDEEKSELNKWISRDYFGGSKIIHGSFMFPYSYSVFLHLSGKSLSLGEIKSKIEQNLPSVICKRLGGCRADVIDVGFLENDGTWGGNWYSYPQQREAWKSLYTNKLSNNNFEITYLSTHGAPLFHSFDIDFNLIKNNRYSSMIYEIGSCNTGNYLYENYIAGNYLFYGNALAVSSYSIPLVVQGAYNYHETEYAQRFLNIRKGVPVIESLFLKNYGNSIYFGDPLLEILPKQASITVTTPNGGETYKIGDVVNVKWQSQGIASNSTVGIWIVGDNWSQDVSYKISNAGSYSWTIPANVKISSQIKIYIVLYNSDGTTNGDVSDKSDNYFTIASSAVAKKLPPCGSYGDLDQDGYVTNADAELPSQIYVGLVVPTDWQRKYGDVSGDYTVGPYDSALIKQYIAGIITTFPICSQLSKPITITYPNGGETFQAGNSYFIKWNAPNVTRVSIDILDRNGKPAYVNNVIPGVLPNNGVYLWKIPADQPIGDYKVKIMVCPSTYPEVACVNADLNSFGNDLSDNYFSIIKPNTASVKVLSPNGGESYKLGDTMNIKWQAQGINKVKIYLSSGSFAYPITTAVDAISGSYNWSIPSDLFFKMPVWLTGNTFKIGVHNDNGENSSEFNDESNSNFTISSGTLSVCTDTDGGIKYDIKGTVDGLADNIAKVFSKNTDYCSDQNTLVEYSCIFNYYQSKDTYTCPNGCENGACKK